MAKLPSSAVGIDIGRHSLKAVLLQRRGNGRLVLQGYATREVSSEMKTVDALAANLKALLSDLGGKGKAYGITVSHSDLLVRIIEQPEMPTDMLREALRLNSQTLLNQDCKDFVLDCDRIRSSRKGETSLNGPVRYAVGGLPRMTVRFIHEACLKVKLPVQTLQVSPLASFNAFSYAYEETWKSQAFVLVDAGHGCCTVIVGSHEEPILVRTLDYGGRAFAEELLCHGASGPQEIVQKLAQEEAMIVENARLSLTELVRSISSSVGFVEARREEIIPRVYVEGGMMKSPTVIKILSEELQLPVETWDPFAKCEMGLTKAKKTKLQESVPVLAAAFGVAAGILKGR